MGSSPEALRISKSANYENINSLNDKKNKDNKMDYTDKNQLEGGDKESLYDMKSDIDFESWMTETEDEDEDIFITPQRVSTGKEERDTIDGIEFLGFETEHDMVEFTKIELDFQGGALQEESVSHSDDGLDMMDDSYTYSESETQTTSQAIVPTKTKDITKIKGWRTKNFAINNNPSDGQCSSSSVGPYEDDDGFVSCDIKIEEDASLDMEEPGDLWTSGEQDLFTHDDPLEKYSSDDSSKKIEAFIGQSPISNSEKLVPGNVSGDPLSPNENIAKENSESIDLKAGRYPKRHSVLSKSLNTVSYLNDAETQVSEIKTPKKRGRKPKTVAEKRLSSQIANQYRKRRRRGRPKGSKNKPFLNTNYQISTNTVNGKAYNLRNSNKESHIVGVGIDNHDGEQFDCLNQQPISMNDVPKEEVEKQQEILSQEKCNSSVLEPVKVKEEPIDYGFTNTDIDEFTETDPIASNVLCCLSTTTLPTYTSPITAITSRLDTTCSSSLACNISNSLSPSLANSIAMPTIPIGKTNVTCSTASTISDSSCYGNTTNFVPRQITNQLQNDKFTSVTKQINENKEDSCVTENVVSLVTPSDKKVFEYGLILSTGVGRPQGALAKEQLRMLRNDKYSIDEHWARFAASLVTLPSEVKSEPVTNTVIIPVRAQSLPFTSYYPPGKNPAFDILSNKSVSPPSRTCGSLQYASPARFTRPVPSAPLARFAPMVGSSVRFRCPRPSGQVGVRTLPSTIRQTKHSQGLSNLNVSKSYPFKILKFADKYRVIRPGRRRIKLLSSEYNSDDIDEEIKKVVDDIVKYVERSEDNDSLIPEDPHNTSHPTERALIPGNAIPRKKKAPMMRELSRLDVNVIEMWDAKNKKCTEEFCKLGCVCESLECCRPAIEEHCGKEACMFNCECEPLSYRRGDSRQLSLLSPLSLLNIPQQNRRVLAKVEKEFQQTVIKAKDETIVVGNSGSSRRKREIKLPGRYRDSYVALGKEYGLVDFKISSDDHVEPPPKRFARTSIINNREPVPVSPKKSSPISSKVTWESRLTKLKRMHGIRKCYVKLERKGYLEAKISEHEERFEMDTSYESENSESCLVQNVDSDAEIDDAKIIVKKSDSRSRNFAVKSTTHQPSILYVNTDHSARTVPVNLKSLKRYKRSSTHEDRSVPPDDTQVLVSSNAIEESATESVLSLNEPKLLNPDTSDLVIDNCAEGFGKIESVTTLSVEQFQKGDLGFGLESKVEEDEDMPIITGETKPAANVPNVYKNYKGKTSGSLSFHKIANLLNRRIRELKESGGNVSFPVLGSEESIHLLPWTVLRSLFHVKEIQLWYYNGSSKLIITSTSTSPGSSFVNLNDTTPSDYETMPPIIKDLFKNEKPDKNVNNPGVYALLHFDGKFVELVGTIYKNQRISQSGKLEQNHSVKIMSGSRADHQNPLSLNSDDSKSIMDLPSSSILDLKKIMNDPGHVPCVFSSSKPSSSNNLGNTTAKKVDDSEITITEVKGALKAKDLLVSSVSLKEKNLPDSVSSSYETKDKNSIQSPSEMLKPNGNVCSVAKSNDKETLSTNKGASSETRIKKMTTVLQSSKVLTASGENVPVPLPSCAVDSRWYVQYMEKEFEVLQVNKCSVRKQLVSESIKMALKHCKIVRLPLQVTRKMNENMNHPSVGVYAVPCISSFVFIGPFNLDEKLNISTGITRNGKFVSVNDTEDKELGNLSSNKSSEKNSPSSIVDILKKLWFQRKKGEKPEPWLYTQKNLHLDEKAMMRKKEIESAVAGCSTSGKDVLKSKSFVIGIDSHNQEIKTNSLLKTNDQEISIIKSIKCPKVSDQEKVVDSKPANKLSSSVAFCSSLLKSGKLLDSKDKNVKSDGRISQKLSGELLASFPSSTSRFVPLKGSLSTLMKTSKKSTPSEASKQLAVPVAGWLVPSYSWIGCMRCNFDVDGGLFFSHPVSGVKMSFSNLESAQLWLDRLFQSAILYIPRHLFITWTLKLDSGDEESNIFNPNILNGDYIMTTKGVYVIDELVPTEAEKYGLKPIEILRLQDKKKRRDLELGFFQLRRASCDAGMAKTSSKVDVVKRALLAIKDLTIESRDLERESKRWKSTKHKSLLHFYSIMKAFPIKEKGKIVAKLKNQFDQIEASKNKSPEESERLLDGLTYSMSRYCGNSSIFGEDGGDSDINEYLSECEEADDIDEIPKVLEKTVKKQKEETLSSEKRQTDSHEDDESVSISLVSSAFNVNQGKSISNSDDVTVTCLSKTNAPAKRVGPYFNQLASLKNANFVRRKVVGDTRQGPSRLIPLKSAHVTLSPEKVSSLSGTGTVKTSASVKKNLFGSSSSNVSENQIKRFKSDPVKFTSLVPFRIKDTKSVVPCDEKETINKTDSQTKYSNNAMKNTGVVAFKNWPSSSSPSIVKNPVVGAHKSAVSSANTLFVNVISSKQSKIVPLHVESPGTSKSFNALRLPVAKGTLTGPKNSLKLLPKDMQHVLNKGQTEPLSVFITNPLPASSRCQAPSAGATIPVTVGGARPLIAVKSFAKESASSSREAGTYLPTLVPIVDGNLKPQDKPNSGMFKPIAPLPTLIPLVDGVPADKQSKKKLGIRTQASSH